MFPARNCSALVFFPTVRSFCYSFSQVLSVLVVQIEFRLPPTDNNYSAHLFGAART